MTRSILVMIENGYYGPGNKTSFLRETFYCADLTHPNKKKIHQIFLLPASAIIIYSIVCSFLRKIGINDFEPSVWKKYDSGWVPSGSFRARFRARRTFRFRRTLFLFHAEPEGKNSVFSVLLQGSEDRDLWKKCSK